MRDKALKAANQKEYRKYLKDHHICRECKTTDAYTLAGRTYCAECAEKMAKYKAQKRAEDGGKSNRERARALREKWAAEGKCHRCGHPLPSWYDRVLCSECTAEFARLRAIDRYNEDYRERGADGICYRCNTRPVTEGKKLCQECYDRQIQGVHPIENHPWKKSMGRFFGNENIISV